MFDKSRNLAHTHPLYPYPLNQARHSAWYMIDTLASRAVHFIYIFYSLSFFILRSTLYLKLLTLFIFRS